MAEMPALFVKKLTYFYADQPVLSDLALSLQFGEGLLVQGHNGSGKSTLIKLVAGLLMPTEGQIEWHPSQTLAFLGHKNGLKHDLTVWENLSYSLRLQGQVLTAQAMEVLEALALVPIKDQITRFLSFGQKRKVALARIFLMNKSAWLLDEPLVSWISKASRIVLNSSKPI